MRSELKTLIRVLCFRAGHDELANLGPRHLVLGLIVTWIVGIGRWWEDPKAGTLQHLGVGSVIYVVVLASFLWLLMWPVTERTWPFRNLLTFITLTAPPALLYAMPVRAVFELSTAQSIRLWLLLIVAAWRVALWARYLDVGVDLPRPAAIVLTFFPLAFIVVALAQLNLDRVVFSVMGGLSPDEITVNDSAYGALLLITVVAVFSLIPLLPTYVVLSVRGVRSRMRARGRG